MDAGVLRPIKGIGCLELRGVLKDLPTYNMLTMYQAPSRLQGAELVLEKKKKDRRSFLFENI